MPFMNQREIEALNFKHIGVNVKLSSLASFDKPHLMSIGDNSRVDDFCALSGVITLGRNVHIAAMNSIVASEQEIEIQDFAGLAFGCRLFSSSDDYSGESMTNPTVPIEFKAISHGAIRIERHSILGTNSIVFPGVNVGEGCAIGANSLVSKSTEPWGIYLGSPARRMKNRSKNLLMLEKKLLDREISDNRKS
jgi:acetyltransferase-like isoleucine patch superfamily enzyme